MQNAGLDLPSAAHVQAIGASLPWQAADPTRQNVLMNAINAFLSLSLRPGSSVK